MSVWGSWSLPDAPPLFEGVRRSRMYLDHWLQRSVTHSADTCVYCRSLIRDHGDPERRPDHIQWHHWKRWGWVDPALGLGQDIVWRSHLQQFLGVQHLFEGPRPGLVPDRDHHHHLWLLHASTVHALAPAFHEKPRVAGTLKPVLQCRRTTLWAVVRGDPGFAWSVLRHRLTPDGVVEDHGPATPRAPLVCLLSVPETEWQRLHRTWSRHLRWRPTLQQWLQALGGSAYCSKRLDPQKTLVGFAALETAQ